VLKIMSKSAATESTAARPSTFLEKLVDRLSQPHAIFALGLTTILLLVCAAYLDGVLAQLFDAGFWRLNFLGPPITVYLLLVSRFLSRIGNQAVDAFRPVVALDHDEFERLRATAASPKPRREWLAVSLGGLIGFMRRRAGPGLLEGFRWTTLYVVLTGMLEWGLLGWVVYRTLVNIRLFSKLHRQPLNIDIFDPTPFEPVARMSLGMSLAILGINTLLLLLTPDRTILVSIMGIILHSALILLAVLVFFLAMADTHRVMAEAKEQKLKLVRRNLLVTFQELEERTTTGQLEGMEALSDSITAWLAYEKRIEEAPEWPYTTDTLRNLIVSTLIPIGAWVAQVIVEFIT
jgi:hypothetical protein